MSFGRPPGFSMSTVLPPDRGSFPLDHEGECKQVMTEYMRCMKENRQDNGKCRHLSRRYLECRMEKGLMEKDEMKNLGFQGNEEPASVKAAQAAAQASAASSGSYSSQTP
ncbi:hypothetical protein BDZ90DRAFT_206332, partial [Jaminaea rosea]